MTSDADLVVIPRRFRGPPGCGNGGYVAGLLAEWVAGPVEVRLMAPSPLDVPLHRRREGSDVSLWDGERLLARARPLESFAPLDLPPPPGADELDVAAAAYPGPGDHPVPGCFVCGPERADDGLALALGESPARDCAVAAFLAPAEFADRDGHVAGRILWAALDCPGYFGIGAPYRPMLLGQIAGRIERPVLAGEALRVAGWKLGHEGRKTDVASALFDSDGALVASARARWLAVDALPT